MVKDIDKQKADVTDLVDTKFDYIHKNLDTQLQTVISTYEDLGGKLNKTHLELNLNFKEKATNIKTMVATFFAKIDKQVSNNGKKTKDVEDFFN